MAIPPSLSTTIVKATYLDFRGNPVKGDVELSFSAYVRVPIDNVVLVPLNIGIKLDETGSFAEELPTDDPDGNPREWMLTVKEKFPGGRSFSFILEEGVAEYDLADLTDVAPVPDPGITVYASFAALQAEISNRQNADLGLVTEANEYTDSEIADLSAVYVDLDATQDVHGVKTFTSVPVLPGTNPSTPNQAARKGYVDAADTALDGRLDAAESDIGAAESDITAIEGDILALEAVDTGLDGRLDTAEGDIDTLQAADLANVKLTGAQTVAGIKTFSSVPVGPASDPTTGDQLARKAYVDSVGSAASGAAVLLTGDQAVAGVKTFSSVPVGPASDPTTANQLARKSYVDTVGNTGVKLTGDQTVAGIKTFSSIPVAPASNPTTDNQLARKAYVDANVIVRGDSGIKYRFISGVLRNTGSGWALLEDSGHNASGMTGVTQSSTGLTIAHDVDALKVSSFQVTPDETYAALGLRVGASVGLDSTVLSLYMEPSDRIGDYNAFTTVWTSYNGMGSVSYNSGTGMATITHEEMSTTPMLVNVSNRGNIIGQVVGMSTTTTQVQFFTYASGLLVNRTGAATSDMKFWWTRFGKRTTVPVTDPAAVSSASGNLWVTALAEVA